MKIKYIQLYTYHYDGVRDACHDVEIVFECEREVIEDAAHEVDGHEHHRDADDLLVLVYLVILRPTVAP